MITRNSKHVKAKPITAEQYLWDYLVKHTKTDPLEDFLKHYESHVQHTKTNAYNEQLDNSSNKKVHETCNMKSHNIIIGVEGSKNPPKILIAG